MYCFFIIDASKRHQIADTEKAAKLNSRGLSFLFDMTFHFYALQNILVFHIKLFYEIYKKSTYPYLTLPEHTQLLL